MNDPDESRKDSTGQFSLRKATAGDADALARHRCEMFKEMGSLQDAYYEGLLSASVDYFRDGISSGEYVGWVVTPAGQPDTVVAGGGMQLRKVLPRPDREGGIQKPGPQGLIMNMYTEPEWRRRGLAELLIRTMIEWSQKNGVASLVLHASQMGRPIYQRLGFLPSNEMFYPL